MPRPHPSTSLTIHYHPLIRHLISKVKYTINKERYHKCPILNWQNYYQTENKDWAVERKCISKIKPIIFYKLTTETGLDSVSTSIRHLLDTSSHDASASLWLMSLHNGFFFRDWQLLLIVVILNTICLIAVKSITQL